MAEQVRTRVILSFADRPHDDILAITCDDAIDELCLSQFSVLVIDIVGQEECVAASGGEGVELRYGTMYESTVSAIDVHAVSLRIADLCIADSRLAVVQSQSVTSHIVNHCVLQSECGIVDISAVADDSIGSCVYVTMYKQVVCAS